MSPAAFPNFWDFGSVQLLLLVHHAPLHRFRTAGFWWADAGRSIWQAAHGRDSVWRFCMEVMYGVSGERVLW